MTIDDFLNLPDEDKALFIDAFNKQKHIRNTRDGIAAERQKLATRELNNQLSCDHPNRKSTYVANENEFGNLTGGGTTYYHCPDCNSRWSE
jgi:hypothetical protein